jgi:hypothetical protein
MPKDQILIGAVTAALCAVGLLRGPWLLENTRKGQRLVRWFGGRRALWLLRGLLVLGIAFGVLLAVDVIRPVQW